MGKALEVGSWGTERAKTSKLLSMVKVRGDQAGTWVKRAALWAG